MSLTRRHFLESASMTLLASAALPTAFAQSNSGHKDDPFKLENLDVLANASEENFKPFIGGTFAVMKAGRQLESLTLLEVASAEPRPPASKASTAGHPPKQAIKCFSLQFQGSHISLPQETYTLKNDSLGSFSLFLVPGGPGKDPQTYTATFSLLVQ